MNYSTAVFLVNKHVRAIRAAYEINAKGEPCGNFEVFKTFDTTIKVGDLIVIPTTTRVKRTVVMVTETDVEVDFESTAQMEWVVDKVDAAEFAVTLEKEQQAISMIKAAELRKKREELAATILANMDPEATKMLELVASPDAPAVADESAPQ